MEDRKLTSSEITNLVKEAAVENEDGSVEVTGVIETASGDFIRIYLKEGVYLSTLKNFAEKAGVEEILIGAGTDNGDGEVDIFFERPSIEDAR